MHIANDQAGRRKRSWRLFSSLSARRTSLWGSWAGTSLRIWINIIFTKTVKTFFDEKSDYISWPGFLLLPGPGLYWGAQIVPGYLTLISISNVRYGYHDNYVHGMELRNNINNNIFMILQLRSRTLLKAAFLSKRFFGNRWLQHYNHHADIPPKI